MSGLLWLLLVAALSAALGFFVLQRRARTAQKVRSRHAGESAPSTRNARDLKVKQQLAAGSPPKEGAVVEKPVVEGSLAAQALLEEWRSATVSPAVGSRERLSLGAVPPVVDKPVVMPPGPEVASEETRCPRQELEKPFLTLEELETSLKYGAMRVRIEEIRSSLKANAFDPGMTGMAAEDSLEGPSVPGSGHFDADMVARIDSMLTEENGLPEQSHRPRASTSAWVQGVRETGRDASERREVPSAGEPPRRRARGRRRPYGRVIRRRTTPAATPPTAAGAVPPPRRSTRRKSRN